MLYAKLKFGRCETAKCKIGVFGKVLILQCYEHRTQWWHFYFVGNNNDAYYEEMQTKISDLSIELLDKLEFLEVSKKGLTNFQVMFIEMEVRISASLFAFRSLFLFCDHS